jgi:hypothetical protein
MFNASLKNVDFGEVFFAYIIIVLAIYFTLYTAEKVIKAWNEKRKIDRQIVKKHYEVYPDDFKKIAEWALREREKEQRSYWMRSCIIETSTDPIFVEIKEENDFGYSHEQNVAKSNKK